jgi:membrane protein YdbS with pleckstrin-like domain
MSRTGPALWSGLVAVPFVLTGLLVVLAADSPEAVLPTEVGYGLVAFGVFITLVGLYVSRVAPSAPTLRGGESVVEVRTPTQRVAAFNIGLSIPLFALTVYLYYGTVVEYVYPALTLVVAFVLFVNGLVAYWRNTLTTYYVTTTRILWEYRFLSLQRREIPVDRIRSIEERQSLTETLTGIGNVRVVSGGGRRMEIAIRNVDGSAALADRIRELT